MSEASQTVTGLFIGFAKVVVFFGGIVTAGIGFFTGNPALIIVGVVAVILGQVLHTVDQRHLDRQLEGWATEAVAGIGPVPPRQVRLQLFRTIMRGQTLRGDVRADFRWICQEWAAKQASSAQP